MISSTCYGVLCHRLVAMFCVVVLVRRFVFYRLGTLFYLCMSDSDGKKRIRYNKSDYGSQYVVELKSYVL